MDMKVKVLVNILDNTVAYPMFRKCIRYVGSNLWSSHLKINWCLIREVKTFYDIWNYMREHVLRVVNVSKAALFTPNMVSATCGILKFFLILKEGKRF